MVVTAASETQIIITLIAGLLMAFSFQLVLANLGVILGLLIPDLLGVVSQESSKQVSHSSKVSSGPMFSAVSAIAGFGILLTINLSLAPASFLAVKLSQVEQPELAAIQGLVLWAAYFLMITWLSSLALNSLLQTLFETMMGGMRQLLSAIASVFNQEPAQADEHQDAVEAEIKTALENFDLEQQIKNHLSRLKPTPANLDEIPQKLTEQLATPALQSPVGKKLLDRVDQHTVTSWLQKHTQFSQLDAEEILEKVMNTWQQFQGLQQSITGQPTEAIATLPETIAHHLLTMPRWNLTPAAIAEDIPELFNASKVEPAELRQQLTALDPQQFQQILKQRDDLADHQIEEAANQLETIRQHVLAEVEATTPNPSPKISEAIATLQTKLESYLRYTRLEKITEAGLEQKLQTLITELALSPEVLQHLPDLNSSDLKEILSHRKGLSAEESDRIMTQLEEIWTRLQPTADSANTFSEHLSEHLSERLTTALNQSRNLFSVQFQRYLQYHPKAAFTPEQISQDLPQMLQLLLQNAQVSGAGLELPTLPDLEAIATLLSERGDIAAEEVEELANQITAAWHQAQQQIEQIYQDASGAVETLLTQIFETVQSTVQSVDLPEIELESLQQDLQNLFQPMQTSLQKLSESLPTWLPSSSFNVLSDRLNQWHQEVTSKLLNMGDDLSENMIHRLQTQLEILHNQLLDQVQQLEQQTLNQLNAIRRGALIAACWLFAIAVSSAVMSALAGMLAVEGLALLPF